MFDETPQEASIQLDAIEARGGMVAQLRNVSHHEVWHLMILGVAPAAFDRVRVRSIRREVERLHPRVGREELLYDLGRMDSCAIPDQLDVPRDLSSNFTEELDHKGSIKVLIGGKHVKQEAFPLGFRGDRYRPNRGDLVSTIPRGEDRGFPTRCQGATPGGHHLKAHLVKEDQGCFVRLGFFLISGSSSVSQALTFSGLRSRAIFSGRWNVQPNFSVTRR